MLNLIKVEFLKLRRRSLIWLMMLAAIFMPALGVFYYNGGVSVTGSMQFYKWSAFSYTQWIILPAVLGIFITMLMYYENQNDMLKQLWIVPVNKLKFLISKFAIVIFYSVCFMLVVAIASVFLGTFVNGVDIDLHNIGFLFLKCLEIGVLTAFAMLPILAIAAAQKGYIFPICVVLLYTFLGFILLMVNMYLHPLSSMSAIVSHDIPGVSLPQEPKILLASICIFLWGIVSLVLANVVLRNRK